MKKFVTSGLIIFIIAVIVIILAGSISSGPKITTPNQISNGIGGSIILTLGEIAKHNSINDCWMIFDNKVYNITQDLQIHPAGANAILPYCGKDGKNGFTTKDRGQGINHSQNAYALLNNFYIGDVGQTIGPGSINVPTVVPGLLRGNDDNEEFD